MASKEMFEYKNDVTELKLALNKARAIADAFSKWFVESNEANTILAIRTSPDKFVYLFEALFDVIVESCNMVEALDSTDIEGGA